jgi:hypothetical protein
VYRAKGASSAHRGGARLRGVSYQQLSAGGRAVVAEEQTLRVRPRTPYGLSRYAASFLGGYSTVEQYGSVIWRTQCVTRRQTVPTRNQLTAPTEQGLTEQGEQ